MSPELGTDYTYKPHQDSTYAIQGPGKYSKDESRTTSYFNKLKGVFGSEQYQQQPRDEDVSLKITNGVLKQKRRIGGKTRDIFHPQVSDILKGEEENASFRISEEKYRFEEFLDAYDLDGEVVLVGRQDDQKTLLDTEENVFDTEYLSSWEEAQHALEENRYATDRPDREYAVGEHAKILTGIVTAAGPDRFTDYNDLKSRLKINVPELSIYSQSREERVETPEQEQPPSTDTQKDVGAQRPHSWTQESREQQQTAAVTETVEQQRKTEPDQEPEDTEQQSQETRKTEQEQTEVSSRRSQDYRKNWLPFPDTQQPEREQYYGFFTRNGAPEVPYITEHVASGNHPDTISQEDIKQGVKEYHLKSGVSAETAAHIAEEKTEKLYQIIKGFGALKDVN